MTWMRRKADVARTSAAFLMLFALFTGAGCAPPSPVPKDAESAGGDPQDGSQPKAASASDKKTAPAAQKTAEGEAAKAPPKPQVAVEEVPPVRKPTEWSSGTINGVKRIEEAKAAKLDIVKGLFGGAGVAYPPSQILLRGFKKENRVEVWAASGIAGPLTHVTTYEVCYASGELGPKRKEGDRQVPEGFYNVNLYNPSSSYHLAFQVSYPNQSDRILGDKRTPGSEIMIHGNCVSIGCLAMSDERIQEIWLAVTAVRDRRGKIDVHLFPTRDMAGLIATTEQKQHIPFWQNIKEGFDYFQQKKIVPRVTVDKEGRYRFSDP